VLANSSLQDIGIVSVSKILNEQIFTLLEQKSYKKAHEQCEAILKINPSNPQTLIYLNQSKEKQ
jgi:hypothetical protein